VAEVRVPSESVGRPGAMVEKVQWNPMVVNKEVQDEGENKLTKRRRKNMKKVMVASICGLLLLMGFSPVQASDKKIEPQLIVDTVKAAVALIAEKGEAAFPILSQPNTKYNQGDLYVFTYNMDGVIIQHAWPHMVGTNMMNVKDPNGKCMGCDFVRIAKEEGAGWSEYQWPKPTTKALATKVAYIMKVPGKEMFVGAGVYDMTKQEAEKGTKAAH
jgi:cytochrome c